MKPYSRTIRIGSLIQRELAVILLRHAEELQLPADVTLNHVKVSPDLSYSKVYITLIGKEEKTDVLECLNNSAGVLHNLLVHQIRDLRRVPKLHFVYDESVERGERLSKLIEAAVISDKDKI